MNQVLKMNSLLEKHQLKYPPLRDAIWMNMNMCIYIYIYDTVVKDSKQRGLSFVDDFVWDYLLGSLQCGGLQFSVLDPHASGSPQCGSLQFSGYVFWIWACT